MITIAPGCWDPLSFKAFCTSLLNVFGACYRADCLLVWFPRSFQAFRLCPPATSRTQCAISLYWFGSIQAPHISQTLDYTDQSLKESTPRSQEIISCCVEFKYPLVYYLITVYHKTFSVLLIFYFTCFVAPHFSFLSKSQRSDALSLLDPRPLRSCWFSKKPMVRTSETQCFLGEQRNWGWALAKHRIYRREQVAQFGYFKSLND